MSGTTTEPGWYHAQGDPFGSQRYWDGKQWQGGPRMVPAVGPGGWGEAGNAVDADRSPFQWFRLALSRWSNFDGRATRAEYWWFTLFYVLSFVAAVFLALVLGRVSGTLALLSFAATFIFVLALIIPSIAVSVRRLHDTNKSGWFYLLGVIPVVNYVGSIVLLVFYCIDGDRGHNEYGASPKYAASHAPAQTTSW